MPLYLDSEIPGLDVNSNCTSDFDCEGNKICFLCSLDWRRCSNSTVSGNCACNSELGTVTSRLNDLTCDSVRNAWFILLLNFVVLIPTLFMMIRLTIDIRIWWVSREKEKKNIKGTYFNTSRLLCFTSAICLAGWMICDSLEIFFPDYVYTEPFYASSTRKLSLISDATKSFVVVFGSIIVPTCLSFPVSFIAIVSQSSLIHTPISKRFTKMMNIFLLTTQAILVVMMIVVFLALGQTNLALFILVPFYLMTAVNFAIGSILLTRKVWDSERIMNQNKDEIKVSGSGENNSNIKEQNNFKEKQTLVTSPVNSTHVSNKRMRNIIFAPTESVIIQKIRFVSIMVTCALTTTSVLFMLRGSAISSRNYAFPSPFIPSIVIDKIIAISFGVLLWSVEWFLHSISNSRRRKSPLNQGYDMNRDNHAVIRQENDDASRPIQNIPEVETIRMTLAGESSVFGMIPESVYVANLRERQTVRTVAATPPESTQPSSSVGGETLLKMVVI